jgi:hypothetical protein
MDLHMFGHLSRRLLSRLPLFSRDARFSRSGDVISDHKS